MGDRSRIEWTDASWTPIRARSKATGKAGWHCEHATPGCANCCSDTMHKRLGTGLRFKPGHLAEIELSLDEKMLLRPRRWTKPRMIFVCSMTDLYAEFVPDERIDKVVAVTVLAPQHTFQVTTRMNLLAGRRKQRPPP
jgi:protein gp37